MTNDWNQPPPLVGYNLYTEDRALREGVRREGGEWIEREATELGELLGTASQQELGEDANRYPPELHTHDERGERIDEVEFHPAWHEQLRIAVEHRLHSLPWSERRPGAHVARGALMILRHQIDEGPSCPLTMTFAAVPSLRLQPELAAVWERRILSTVYDRRFRPPDEKLGVLIGMAMTERQGGSDVRANRTRAEPLGAGGPGGEYALDGHKWFCSAPMSDAFLVLAQAAGGLSCFLLPRWRPDDTRNAFHIVRLKEKLGNRSNASSEIELDGAWARMIGEEGRGVANIIEMVHHTRLDCALGSAATLRRAVAEATHHCHHRHAFGKPLIEQPLMRNVLADLAVESEAATALALRLARGFDEAGDDEEAAGFVRLATPVAKYWVTKRAVGAVAEALECLGGNGYVEASPLPRLYRDVPLNSLWEGSANVQCLDVLRALGRDGATLEVFLAEVRRARGADRRFDAFLDDLEGRFSGREPEELEARTLTERLALALQASLLLRGGPAAVADAFCASRLADAGGRATGTLPPGLDLDAILDRARPRPGD